MQHTTVKSTGAAAPPRLQALPLPLLLVAGGTLLYLLSLIVTGPLVFLTSDIGLRYLQLQSLIESRGLSLAIPYGAAAYDPTLAHVPYYFAYSILEGAIYLHVSPFFPLLAAPAVALAGPLGLPLIPVGGAMVTAWASHDLVRLYGGERPRLALLTVLFATPLLIYTLLFWDHTLGVALTTLALLGVGRGVERGDGRALFLGGLAAGLALGQRPEAYLFGAALGGALLLGRLPVGRIIRVALGGAAGALPLWALQWLWVGHPLGMATAPHVSGYGRPSTYPFGGIASLSAWEAKANLLLYLLGRPSAAPLWLGAVLLVGGIGAVVIATRPARWRPRLLFAGWGAVLGSTALSILLAWSGLFVMGLISTLPLAALSLAGAAPLHPDEPAGVGRGYRFLALVTGLFVTAMLLLWPSSGGLQWGARYLLPAVPPLVVMAFLAYTSARRRLPAEARPALRAAAAGLLLASLLLQGSALRLLTVTQGQRARLVQAAQTLPRVVLTNFPFAAAHLGGLEGRDFLYVRDGAGAERLARQIAGTGEREIGLVLWDRQPIEVAGRFAGFVVTPISSEVYVLKRSD